MLESLFTSVPICIVRMACSCPLRPGSLLSGVSHLTYQHIKDGKKKFEIDQVVWGIDLQSEHERYLAEEVFKCPLIVYNYPKEIKSFYMRLNEDGKTVAAMDVLVPGVGELIGGSQREERADELEKRIVAAGLSKETYSWYLDLRRYGTVPHSGFGLGFERLVSFFLFSFAAFPPKCALSVSQLAFACE